MNQLVSQLESVLFLAAKPMKEKKLLKITGASIEDFGKAVEALVERHSGEGSGLRILRHDGTLQFTTSEENAGLVESVYNSEMTGELTKPALETLTIIAYRGPITKPELELIRGVNCSLIIRNLAMRGLIKEDSSQSEMMPTYTTANEFLQYLGMTSVKELPSYDELSSNELLTELINQRTQEGS